MQSRSRDTFLPQHLPPPFWPPFWALFAVCARPITAANVKRSRRFEGVGGQLSCRHGTWIATVYPTQPESVASSRGLRSPIAETRMHNGCRVVWTRSVDLGIMRHLKRRSPVRSSIYSSVFLVSSSSVKLEALCV